MAEELHCSECGKGPFKSERGVKVHEATMHDQPWQNEETLRREYHEKGKSTYQLSQEWGCDNKAILNWMDRFGIERRPPTKDIDRGWRDKEKMERLYLGYEMSVEDIAAYLETDNSVIVRWLARHGIETRPQLAPSGPDHPDYLGGRTQGRGETLPIQKRKALRRDQHRCQGCGKTSVEMGREPDVHHIEPYDPDLPDAPQHRLDNLICLCKSCHLKDEPIHHLSPIIPDKSAE